MWRPAPSEQRCEDIEAASPPSPFPRMIEPWPAPAWTTPSDCGIWLAKSDAGDSLRIVHQLFRTCFNQLAYDSKTDRVTLPGLDVHSKLYEIPITSWVNVIS